MIPPEPEQERLQRELRAVWRRLALGADGSQQEAELRRALRWLEVVGESLEALFSSVSWRSGRALVSVAERLLRRAPTLTVREHLEQLLRDVATWRARREVDEERPLRPAIPRPGWIAQRVQWERPATVDLVVWAEGAPDDLRPALERLTARTVFPHRLILADPGHDSAVSALLESTGEERLAAEAGFASALNTVWQRLGAADYLVVLSGRARVSRLWLARLVLALEHDPLAGLASPLTRADVLLPANWLSAGGHPDPRLGVDGFGQLLERAGFHEGLELALPSRHCVALRRHTLESIGPLDERLEPASALLDLSLRAEDAGVATLLAPLSFVACPPDADCDLTRLEAKHGPRRLAQALEAERRPAPQLAPLKSRLLDWLRGSPLPSKSPCLRVLALAPVEQAEHQGDLVSLLRWLRSSGIQARLAVVGGRGESLPAGEGVQRCGGPVHHWAVASQADLVFDVAGGATDWASFRELHPGTCVLQEPDAPSDRRGRLEWLGARQAWALAASTRQATGVPKVAVLPVITGEGTASGCGYIRLLLPLQHPRNRGRCTVEVSRLEEVLHVESDVIVVQRNALPGPVVAQRLIARCRAEQTRLVLDLDDDLLASEEKPDLQQPLLPRELDALRRLALAADAVVTSTPALAARMRPLNPNVSCVPNALDERLWGLGLGAAPREEVAPDAPVRLLYMGTHTHRHDLDLVRGACQRLQREYGSRLEIECIGGAGPGEGVGRAVDPGGEGASSDYPLFVEWIQARRPRWDVGLAPLQSNAFNRCKSAIKFLDYAALGLATVCSDVEPYRGVVRPGENGLLVGDNPEAWYEAIRGLVEDAECRRTLASAARDDLVAGHMLADRAPDFLDAYLGATSPR